MTVMEGPSQTFWTRVVEGRRQHRTRVVEGRRQHRTHVVEGRRQGIKRNRQWIKVHVLHRPAQ